LGENPAYYKAFAHVDKNIRNILDDERPLDECIHIANISKTKMDEWNTKSLTTFERWSEIFEFVRSECISLKNIQLILEFSSAVPGTSAAIERLFAIINALRLMKRAVSFLKPSKQW
jgi:hypothetical protein